MAPISVASTLSELIYAMEVSATYHQLEKATDDDLREFAKHALRAAKIFEDVTK